MFNHNLDKSSKCIMAFLHIVDILMWFINCSGVPLKGDSVWYELKITPVLKVWVGTFPNFQQVVVMHGIHEKRLISMGVFFFSQKRLHFMLWLNISWFNYSLAFSFCPSLYWGLTIVAQIDDDDNISVHFYSTSYTLLYICCTVWLNITVQSNRHQRLTMLAWYIK